MGSIIFEKEETCIIEDSVKIEGNVTIKPNTAGWNITNTYSSNTHYININPNNKTATVNIDLLYDNIALLPNNLYKDTIPEDMPPLAGCGTNKSAFCYTFRST